MEHSDVEFDEPKEKCGVFGIFAPELNVAKEAFFALVALQHRGQESCGIATCEENGVFHIETGMGLVNQVFNEENIKSLKGSMALGHTRYSTAGKSVIINAQPVIVSTLLGQVGIVQNGNLTRAASLKRQLLNQGVGLFRDSDVEIITQLLAANPPEEFSKNSAFPPSSWEARISHFMNLSDGAYSLVVMTSTAIYGLRDYLGLRPLCIGAIDIPTVAGITVTRYLLASESCALSTIGARYVREVQPGEIVKLDHAGLTSYCGRPAAPKPAFCVFEYVYFARPDSYLEDQLVHSVRQRLGRQLALECPPPAGKNGEEWAVDTVIGVPDSSLPAAIGYAAVLKLPYTEGLTKNRYIHRTFIQPTDHLRQLGLKMKFNPLVENLRGKRIILIDDSLVRGNTLKALIQLIRGAGVVSVHVRITSPEVKNPCFMGIDMATHGQLIAHNKTTDQIRAHIGADSLGYLSHEGMLSVVREGVAPGKGKGYCSACFTGEYPLSIDW